MKGVQDFKIGELKDGKVEVTIAVKINNPNRYKIKIKKTDFDLFVEGKSIGQAKMKEDLTIEKKIEQNYDLVVQADYDEIKKSAGTILTAALFQKTINVQVKGKVRAVVRGIFSKKMEVDVKKDILLKDFMGKF